MKGWNETEQDRRLAELASDPERADLEPVDRAIVHYALRLTREPAAISAADVDELRARGLDDRGIHDLCSIVAYFAFVNRIADGLGVELESP